MVCQIIGWCVSVVSAVGIMLTPRLRCNEVMREGVEIVLGVMMVFALGFSLAALPLFAQMHRSWRYTGLIALFVYIGVAQLAKYIARDEG